MTGDPPASATGSQAPPPLPPLRLPGGRATHPAPPRRADIGVRTLTILVGLPIFIALLAAGGVAWRVMLGILVLVGAWEWVALARAGAYVAAPEVVLPGAVLLFWAAARAPGWVSPTLALVVGGALVAQLGASRRGRALANAGITVLGPCYVALFAALAVLRDHPDGLALALLTVAAVWVADTAAYLGGRAVGRRRLAPAISPGKTWEGAAIGLLAALAAAAAVAWGFRLGLVFALTAAAVAWAAGSLGDLAESALKRAAGVKDTGAVLPGHGGVLDRFDALLFATPAVLALVALWHR